MRTDRGSRGAGARPPALEQVLKALRHELRNTLSPILTIVDVLNLRGDGGPEVEMLSREVRLLMLMHDDLWSLTRAAAGQLEVTPSEVALDDVVARMARATAIQLDQMGVKLVPTVPVGLRVMADPVCLCLALASAVRHVATPAARVTLEAARGPTEITVRVRSSEATVPADRALLFARQLVELQGGTLTSSDGLRVSLPVAPIG